jgi:hypothetical protein
MAPKKAGDGLDARLRLGLEEKESPAVSGGALAISVAVRAEPDQLIAILTFDLSERCVDRSGEARIVELD